MYRHGSSALLGLTLLLLTAGTARADAPAFVPAATPLATDWRPVPAVADLDGDGRDDLVVSSGAYASTLKVLLTKPEGGFDTAWEHTFDRTINRVSLADLDGDGRPDIVAESTFEFTVLRAQPDATYAVTLERDHSGRVGIGDLTGDARADLAYVNFGADGLNVAAGQPDGTFTFSSLPTLGTPSDLQVADFSGDGRLDVLAIHNDGYGSSFFAGGPTGLTPAIEYYGSGDRYGPPLTLDLDGDGDVDRAVLDRYGDRIDVTYRGGDPDRTYQGITLGGSAGTLEPGDFNGDGLIDIATVATTFDDDVQLVIVPGVEGGRFGAPLVLPLGDRAYGFGFTTGDFDGDGQTDFLIGDAAGDAWGLRTWTNRTPAVELSAPETTRDKAFDVARLVGKAAQLRLHIAGPGREQELVLTPRSGATRVEAWADGDYRLHAVALDAGGREVGTADAITTVDTAGAIELETPPMPAQLVGGVSAPFTVRVYNRGVRPATIRSVTFGDELQVERDGCGGTRVGANSACTVTVRFAPAADGVRAVAVVVDADSLFTPRRLSVTGFGWRGAGPVTISPLPRDRLPAPARLSTVRLVVKARAGSRTTRFSALRLEGLPRSTTVTATCRPRCARKSLTRTKLSSGELSLASLTKKRALAVGARVTVRIAAPGEPVVTITLTVRARRAPAVERS